MSQPKWKFEDARGVERVGVLDRFTDYGGTDVTYWFKDSTDNTLHLVSGARLKNAQRIWE
jgi:hypothetical protein